MLCSAATPMGRVVYQLASPSHALVNSPIFYVIHTHIQSGVASYFKSVHSCSKYLIKGGGEKEIQQTKADPIAINMDEELPPAYKILLERFSSGELSYVDVINDLHHPNSNVFVPKMKAYMNAITESRSNIGIDLDEIERMHTYDQLKRQASNIRQELKEQKRQNEELTIMKDLVMIRNKAGSSCHNKMSTAQYNNTSKFESVSINNNKTMHKSMIDQLVVAKHWMMMIHRWY